MVHEPEDVRNSGGADGFAVASQFSANIGENEAYLATSLVRGLVGRGIFSANQALVVARSDESDPVARDAIESDMASLLRAINNGGTLVGCYTMPMYAHAGSTASSAIGVTVGAGVIGPISGEGTERTGAGSGVLEGLVGLPVRDLTGTASVLADIVVGARAGYTYTGGPLRAGGGFQDVSYAQMMVGLRQNQTMTVSALVTFANHGFNDLVPRLAVNFAAHR